MTFRATAGVWLFVTPYLGWVAAARLQGGHRSADALRRIPVPLAVPLKNAPISLRRRARAGMTGSATANRRFDTFLKVC
jgi:hypothetical protein